ncbi:hypothetical protein CFK38_08935 [Brachybacterium vulturis]|uniref:Uncharacterized protein n=1 Tax=Brachybacterium vulturis TaxID=2017484 RepID=A0A291GNN1_9MICO|nr:hypothetical protein CFK38_08935 [Brachybacterium vulturis]
MTPATRIVLTESARDLEDVADLLAEELVSEGHLVDHPAIVFGGRIRPLDIVLERGPVADTNSREAYSITTDHRYGLTLRAPTNDGMFWATRTLLQVLRRGRPTGRIVDWPELEERTLMLDIGRKYFSPEWIKTLIREMSYLKMNTLQLHISEGLGFRVECESHPEIVSEEHLTKDQVRDILDVARTYHVRVNADVDTPGHLDHILSFHPELQLVLANGTRHAGHLDFSKPEARQLVHEIVAEMCDLFDGPVFHLGGDEYFPAPWQGTGPDVVSDESAPQLVEYARAVTGQTNATAHDGYEHYLNELAALVRSTGKTARVFNDDVYPGEGVGRLDARTEVDVWIRWNASKPDAGDFVDAGHSVINANGDYLYFILTSEGLGQGPYKNPKGIYERWTPRTFMGLAGSQGDYILPPEKPMLGSHLSVWCDSPHALTQTEVATLLQEWLQVFAQQTWGSDKLVPTLEDLRAAVLPQVGTAPAAID